MISLPLPPASSQPQLIVVGGPNGAGKTTFVRSFLQDIPFRYLGADQIAYELCPKDVASVAVRAGREFLRQIREARESRESVIVESTLAGKGLARDLRDFRDAGYEIRLIFISLPSSRTSEERVALRVSKGGHHVPRKTFSVAFTAPTTISGNSTAPLRTDGSCSTMERRTVIN